MGLTLNTKGPVCLLPFAFWIIYFKKEIINLSKSPFFLMFFVLGGFWYAGLELQEPGTLMRLITNEIIKRSTTDLSGRNAFWWAVCHICHSVDDRFKLLADADKEKKALALITQRENQLYLVWVLTSLLLFSFIQSRLVLYLLPLSIPMAFLLA